MESKKGQLNKTQHFVNIHLLLCEYETTNLQKKGIFCTNVPLHVTVQTTIIYEYIFFIYIFRTKKKHYYNKLIKQFCFNH